jgi:hypothetical protein
MLSWMAAHMRQVSRELEDRFSLTCVVIVAVGAPGLDDIYLVSEEFTRVVVYSWFDG